MTEAKAPEATPKPGKATRLVSIVALIVALFVLENGCTGAYEAVRDSWISPKVLSPDADIVVQSSVEFANLQAQREKFLADETKIKETLAGDDDALQHLHEIKTMMLNALHFTATMTGAQKGAYSTALNELATEAKLLQKMADEQTKYVEDAKKNAEAGLITKVDLQNQVQLLERLRLSAVESQRTRIEMKLKVFQSDLTSEAIDDQKTMDNAWLLLPEGLSRQDTMVNIEIEEIRLETERRGLLAQQKADETERAKVEEVIAKMRTRPLFRALDGFIDVGFVPYRQLAGVEVGADVYNCYLGLFFCRLVGRVSEVLPGEVIELDPWGQPARGQYAVLDLTNRDATRQRSLRVRASTKPKLQVKPPQQQAAR